MLYLQFQELNTFNIYDFEISELKGMISNIVNQVHCNTLQNDGLHMH